MFCFPPTDIPIPSQNIYQGYCVDQNFVNTSAAVSMAEDAYANYVMKTVLDIVEEGPKRERMFGMLLSNLGELVSIMV